MSELIVYKSVSGFTKKYVDSLARRLVESKVVELKDFKVKDAKNYDFIFYGAPLRNNQIMGLNKFLKNYEKFKDKNIFIFATGIEPVTKDKRENVIAANGLEFYHIRLYLLPGGMDLNKLPKMQQFLMRKGMKYAAKKEGVNEDLLRSRFEYPMDMVNLNELDKMVDVYCKIKLNPVVHEVKDNEE